MISLKQIIPVLEALGIKESHIELVIDELKCLLAELDEVEVKGRSKVNDLLGCMMAIEQIIGEENNG